MNVWFNKSFTVTAALIRALQDAPVTVHASHTDPTHAMLGATPHAFLEPRGSTGPAYAEWLLQQCKARHITLLIAGKEREHLADWVPTFAQAGVQLLTPATRTTQQHLELKDEFLRDWPQTILPLPRWTTFTTLEEFDQGVHTLRTPGTRLCMKPARGIYASGFRVLLDTPNRESFFGGELYEMTFQAARELLRGEPVQRMLLMHTLEGPERSIDCVAWQGDLLAAVVRRKVKDQPAQHLEDHPDLVEAARQIAQHYGLNGIFNVQTKDDAQGRPNILEINARPSGGLHYSLASGVNFPRVLLDAATGHITRPHPSVNLTVAEEKTFRIVQRVTPLPEPDPVPA